MSETCGDNRFEIINAAKKDLLESTNINTSPKEMEVIDHFLFRCWQMGWLDKYVNHTQKSPNAVVCDIKWKDTNKEECGVIITMFDTEGTPIDERCFFNAGSIDGLLSLIGKNSREDFEITKITEFIVI